MKLRIENSITRVAKVGNSRDPTKKRPIDHYKQGTTANEPAKPPHVRLPSVDYSQATSVAEPVPAALVKLGFTVESWGQFLSRAVSSMWTDAERSNLKEIAAQCGQLPDVASALQILAQHDPQMLREDGDRMVVMGASMALIGRLVNGHIPTTIEQTFLETLSSGTELPSYSPPESLRDGEIETTGYSLLKQISPPAANLMLRHHPHLTRGSDLKATEALISELEKELGPFLKDFNVLTCMHQMGRNSGWLELLSTKLGMKPEDYLGISVPYSESELAIARANLDGFRTEKVQFLDPILQKAGLSKETLEDAMDKALFSALKSMIERSRENEKKILVIDDGGHLVAMIHEHFPEEAHRFTAMEWTTRGAKRFDGIEEPLLPLLSGAESKPKNQLEPPFIAQNWFEIFHAALKKRGERLRGRRVSLLGFGNIGASLARKFRTEGAKVTIYDKVAAKRELAVAEGFDVKENVSDAVKNSEFVVLATGTTSLSPGELSQITPNARVFSASSLDVEIRKPYQPGGGLWNQDTHSLRLTISPPGIARKKEPMANTLPAVRSLQDDLQQGFGKSGLVVGVQQVEMPNSVFPLNLTRRARAMELEKEELILLNMTVAIAEAASLTTPGKHQMSDAGEAKVFRHHAAAYPSHKSV